RRGGPPPPAAPCPWATRWSGGRSRLRAAHAVDLRAQATELVLDALVAAIDVVDAAHLRLVLGHEPGDDERCAGAEIRRHDARAVELVHALNDGGVPPEGDARPHAL